jgi:hypothetical protein
MQSADSGPRSRPGAEIKLHGNEAENAISPLWTAKNLKLRRKTMGRNFGVPRQIDRHERTPVWPTWLVTFAIKLGIINSAKFPYRG